MTWQIVTLILGLVWAVVALVAVTAVAPTTITTTTSRPYDHDSAYADAQARQ